MRTALLLLKMLHERFPWPHDLGGHNLTWHDGKLYLGVFVGIDEEDRVCWHSIELESADLDANAVEIFRSIVPIIEADGNKTAHKYPRVDV
jgi:hypothetical protein